MAVKFNDRVKIAEFERGPGQRHQFAGGYVEIIRQYSDQLNDIQYSEVAPTDINVNTLVNIIDAATASSDDNTIRSRPRDMTIENFHIKPDGCVYQGNSEHSSRVVRIEGNVVYTEGGSRYMCVKRDSAIKQVMKAIMAAYHDYPQYNYLNPFSPDSLPLLFAAELLVYGSLVAKKDQVLQRLTNTIPKLNFGERNPYELVIALSQ